MRCSIQKEIIQTFELSNWFVLVDSNFISVIKVLIYLIKFGMSLRSSVMKKW
jgi:hypothetical protein